MVGCPWVVASCPPSHSLAPAPQHDGGDISLFGGFSHMSCIPRDFHGAIGCSCVQKSPMGCSNGAEMGLSASVSVEGSGPVLDLHGQGETCLLPRSYFVIESAEHVTMYSFY